MTPLPPAICVISRFLTKLIVSQNIFWNVYAIKKANWIFEELSNLYLTVMLTSFFPRLLWIPAVKRTKLKKLSIWTTKSGGTQHHKQTNKQTNYTWLFMSNCNNSDILNWTYFCIILIVWIHSATNLKTYEQAKSFFNQANTQSSSGESLKEKRKTFSGMCSLSWSVFATLSNI